MVSTKSFLIWVTLILCVFSTPMKLAGASQLHSRSYEMTWSRCRRLLGLGASKSDKPHDEPCCGNY
ncbi:unnamed protein product [Lathyrus oleraceus]